MLCGWCRLQKRLCKCKFMRWPRPRKAGLAPVGGSRDHIPAHVAPPPEGWPRPVIAFLSMWPRPTLARRRLGGSLRPRPV